MKKICLSLAVSFGIGCLVPVAFAESPKPLSDYQNGIAAQAICDINILNVPSNVVTNEVFKIGTRTYQFVTNATQVFTSNIPVIVGAATNSSNAAITNAVRTINTNNPSFNAVATPDGTNLVLYALSPLTRAVACTETLSLAGNVWVSATTYGGVAEASAARRTVVMKRSATTAEVTAGYMAFQCNFAPAKVIVYVTATTTGVPKAWVGATTISGNTVILDNSGATDFANTDVVTVLASD